MSSISSSSSLNPSPLSKSDADRRFPFQLDVNDANSIENLQKIANLQLPFIGKPLPEAKPSDPLLTRFYGDKLIPKSFVLSAAQEKLLHGLFQKWHLDNQLSLIDLLGLEMCEQLKKIGGQSDSKEKLLDEFGAVIMKVYILLSREEDRCPKESQQYIDHYLCTREQVCTRFNKLLQQITLEKKGSIIARGSAPALQGKLLQLVDKLIDPLAETIKLFLFCLTSPHSRPLLSSQNCSYFVGAEALSTHSQHSLPHLRCYAQYVSLICDRFQKSKAVAFFPHPVTEVGKEFDNPIGILLSLPQKIYAKSESMKSLQEDINADLQSAKRGDLSHSGWLQCRGIQAFSANRKPQAEFVETLYINLIYANLGNCFLMDLHRLLDFQVLKHHFLHRYIPRSLLVNRLKVNINSLDGDHSVELHHPFQLQFRSELNQLVQPLIAMKFKLPDASSTLRHIKYDVLPTDLKWAQEGIAAYETICRSLPTIRLAMMARLVQILPLQGVSLLALQAIAFQECTSLCRIAMILRDASALLGIDALGEDIHPNLADLIMLKGLEVHLASRVPLPSSPPPSPQLTASNPIGVPAAVKQLLALPVKRDEMSPVLTAVASSASSSSAPSASLPSEEFKLENRNLRKVLQKLQQAGFQIFRTRGHHILKRLDGGSSVVVPTHGDMLKEGTVKSIEKQARQALLSSK